MSASQANVLLTLWAEGPMPIGELQALLALSSSAFTGALDRMEKAELVRRVPSPTDRRSFIVEPVAWSSTRRGELLDALLAAEDEFLAALGKSERASLLELLRKIGGGD
jgi:MarR family 2-MHQ and catechol resistance regulon transcriptional repressor